MWYNILTQTELTINLLRQANLNPRMSAWEYYNGPFEYSATPLGTLGCKIMIHNTSNTRKYWDQIGREGFSIGPALHHYRCIQAIYGKTKALIITDTAEYLHRYLTQPHITAEERMTHDIQFLTAALKDGPARICNSQLAAIDAVRTIFSNGTIKSSQNKISQAPLMKNPAKPEKYRLPTSKGDQVKKRPQFPRVY